MGGVSGYCYSILSEKEKLNDEEIVFLDKTRPRQSIFGEIKSKITCNTTIRRILRKEDKIEKDIINYITNVTEDTISEDFSAYDVIHFQTTFDLFRARKSLDNYKGKVLLTSHSPKVSYKEYIEDCVSNETYLKYKLLFDNAEAFDEYAFNRADYIVFPCEGAEEPYFHSWDKYEKIRDNSKMVYIPTGIIPVSASVSRELVRKKYCIPNDAILLSFVGRHNEVKGYDILKEIFTKLNNVYVICCGNIGRIVPPESNRWIEVGWTSDPYSIVAASDIYMLPNRETYFDIAMLQTLSIGKCSVISNTGGNKEFKETPGVKLYDTIEDAIVLINEYIQIPYEERLKLEVLQRQEFKHKYDISVFYKNYKEFLWGIAGKGKSDAE